MFTWTIFDNDNLCLTINHQSASIVPENTRPSLLALAFILNFTASVERSPHIRRTLSAILMSRNRTWHWKKNQVEKSHQGLTLSIGICCNKINVWWMDEFSVSGGLHWSKGDTPIYNPFVQPRSLRFPSIGSRSGFFLSSRNYFDRVADTALFDHDLIMRECCQHINCTAKGALEKVD